MIVIVGKPGIIVSVHNTYKKSLNRGIHHQKGSEKAKVKIRKHYTWNRESILQVVPKGSTHRGNVNSKMSSKMFHT